MSTGRADSWRSHPDSLRPTSSISETSSRTSAFVSTLTAPATGVLRLTAIALPGGRAITSISWMCGTTALTTSGTGPHFWVALYSSALALLRQSADDVTATWNASTVKTVNLTSAFTTTYEGLHYVGLMVASGSTGVQPTLSGVSSVSVVTALAPTLSGTSTTGLTDTAPDPAAAISNLGTLPYVYVS